MKQLFTLAFIIMTAAACTDNSEPDNPAADAGSYAGKAPIKMLQQELPTTFIPDSMWEWHNWVKL